MATTPTTPLREAHIQLPQPPPEFFVAWSHRFEVYPRDYLNLARADVLELRPASPFLSRLRWSAYEYFTNVMGFAFTERAPQLLTGAGAGEALTEQTFRSALLAALEAEPIEDGYRHPAEAVLRRGLASVPHAAAAWLQSLFEATAQQRPTVAAALLQCLGRLPRRVIEPWVLLLAYRGLEHSNVELRDAAAGALERWEGRDIVEVLLRRAAVEPVPWLAQYMRDVAADLAGGREADGLLGPQD